MSNPGPAPELPLSTFDGIFADVYGIQLAGIFVSCALYGASALQVFVYYINKPQDKIGLKILPIWLIIVETIHQFLLCVALYKLVVNNFGNQGVINIVVPELFVGTLFQGFVTYSAQLFFIYRIWNFSKLLKLFPIFALPLATLTFGLTLANNSLVLKNGSISFLSSILWTTYATHAINTFLDVVFSIAMVYLLTKENTLFVKHNGMVQRFVIVVVNTGLVTSIATLLTVIFLKAEPVKLVYVFFDFLISPLYVNSVLANLNSREYIRGPAGTTTSAMELQFQSQAAKTMPETPGEDPSNKSVGGSTSG